MKTIDKNPEGHTKVIDGAICWKVKGKYEKMVTGNRFKSVRIIQEFLRTQKEYEDAIVQGYDENINGILAHITDPVKMYSDSISVSYMDLLTYLYSK